MASKARTVALGSSHLLMIGLLVGLIGCSVTLSGGTESDAQPLTVTFKLGDVGLFSLSAGVPLSNSARISGLDTPTSMPTVAAMRLNDSDITVTPLGSGREAPAGQSLSGSFSMDFRIAAGDSLDPCAEGVNLGSIAGTVSGGSVALGTPSLTLDSSAMAMVMSNDFTLCMTVEADFDGTLVVDQIAFDFNGSADADSATTDDSEDLSDASDDGASDSPIVDDEGSDDDDADGSFDDGMSSDDDGSTDDEISTDSDPGDDDPVIDDSQDEQEPDVDDDADTGLTYSNLTNELDQDSGSTFDTTNTQPTVSSDGAVIAYLSNVPTAGESDGVENYEIMLMIGSAKVQVTDTTEITNTSDNTYDVTNYGPVISRDGSTLAFGSDGDLLNSGVTGTEQIYRYDVAGGSLRQLSALDTLSGGIIEDYAGAPRISADGNVVAWIETDAECSYFGCPAETRFRATDGDGNPLMTVVFDSTFDFSDYTLSGDGETVAFISNDDPVGQNSGGRNQLFLMSIPGGGITQVSQLAAGGGAWTPSYEAPGLNDDATLIAVWTNDPSIASSEYSVLAVLDDAGNLVTTLAEQALDFTGGDDDLGRPRFSAGSAYVCFRTAWSFGYLQRNFRATVGTQELVDVGIGDKTNSPTMTDDGTTLFIAGDGYDFIPEQLTTLNSDGNVEIWSVYITP